MPTALKRKTTHDVSPTGHHKRLQTAAMGEARINSDGIEEPQDGGDPSLDSENGSTNVYLGPTAESDRNRLEQIIDRKSSIQVPSPSSQYKVPTSVELAWLKEAADIYKSSSFKLKIDALLPIRSPKDSNINHVNSVLHELHAHLTALPSIEPHHPLHAARKLANHRPSQSGTTEPIAVLYPDPRPTEETNWKVAFQKPDKVSVVGSWANGLSVVKRKANSKEKFCVVDLAVEMPSSLIQEKDYLDSRIFHKKAYYLAIIASSLISAKSPLDMGPSDVYYSVSENNLRRSSLIVRIHPNKTKPTQSSSTEVLVRILVTLAADSPIPMKRLLPSVCNIRTPVLDSAAVTNSSASEPKPSPTQMYNNDMLLMATPVPYLLASFAISKEVPGFKDCVKLLGLWGSRRGYVGVSQMQAESEDTFAVTGFEDGCVLGSASWWSALLTVLIWGKVDNQSRKSQRDFKIKTIGRGLSSYQMFRAVIGFLANHNFDGAEPIVSRGHLDTPSADSAAYIASATSPCLVGPSAMYNFLGSVPSGSLRMLQHDARLTLRLLDMPIVQSGAGSTAFKDAFDVAFMTSTNENVLARFDLAVRIDMCHATLPSCNNLDWPSRRSFLLNRLNEVTTRALGSRAELCVICIPASSTSIHPLGRTKELSFNGDGVEPGMIVVLGVILSTDSSHSLRLVDHGPPASDVTACAQFREFWGEKSEMRRFSDGSIVESVVWSLDEDNGRGLMAPDERVKIPGKIVQFVLERHLGIPPRSVEIIGNDASPTESVLAFPSHQLSRYYLLPSPIPPTSTTFSISQRLLHSSYNNLIKRLKTVDAIPLSLLSALPISEHLRYTSTFPPIPVSGDLWDSTPGIARFLPVVDVILQFERSSRWPNELEAIQKVKIALLEAIARALLEQPTQEDEVALVASISLSPNALPIEDSVALDVLTRSGFGFRFRVSSSHEQILLERTATDIRGAPDHERKVAQRVLDAHLHRFVRKPQHHNAIHSFQHHHPSFGHTTRLLKRWLAAHWLLPHLTVEAIEIICVSIYTNAESDGSLQTPHSGLCGFTRALKLLSEWDWKASPLMVPLYAATASSSSSSEGQHLLSPHIAKSMQEEFSRNRSTNLGLSKAAWCIATEEDICGQAWTIGVDAMIASRVQVVAIAAVKLLKDSLALGRVRLKALFVHPVADYDFLIHINPSMIPTYVQSLEFDPTTLADPHRHKTDGHIMLDFDPLRSFYHDIKRIYGDNLALFYDPFGGRVIGGVWNPMLRASRPHRILLGFSPMPAQSEGKVSKAKLNVVLNEKGILAEIQRLGGDLIERVEVL